MKRKILNIILIITTLLVLVSCIELKDIKEYESPSNFESKIVATTSEIKKTSISVMANNRNVGSAIIVDHVKDAVGELYTAVTASSVLEIDNKLKVGTRNTTAFDTVKNYTKNDRYGVGLIQFYSKANLEVANIFKSSKTMNHDIGQSIITIGTSDQSNYNTTRVGMITNSRMPYKANEGYAFMHDATTNPGDIGGGVFDLNGNLLGINIENYKLANSFDQTYSLGSTLAVPSSRLDNLLKNLPSINFNADINDSFFITEGSTNNYNSSHPYEQTHMNLSDDLRKYGVTATKGNDIASGLVYAGSGNTYWIITKDFDSLSNIDIYSSNKEKLNIVSSYHLSKFYLSLHKVTTSNSLDVYNSSAINELKGHELVEGQGLVSIGTPLFTENALSFNRAVLSKSNYDTGIFMHEGNLNFGQKGAPLFNLKGELLGFNIEQINSIPTGDGEIISEGLSFAVDINYVAEAIKTITDTDMRLSPIFEYSYLSNTKAYTAATTEERLIINLVTQAISKTVTVKAGQGHGSGTIYKKERAENGMYRYYVLTNHHVISDGNQEEISIMFNDDRGEIFADDYTSSPLYDVGVVRFTTSENYEVLNSKAINDGEGINPVKGQLVVAIGTPQDTNKNGYVTTGNITDSISSYGSISNLAISHNTAINPGNSGGPLFDLNGNLIGINVSKTTVFDTNYGQVPAEGVGTSLNINVIAPIINTYKESDYIKTVRKPRLGITVTTDEGFIGDTSLLPSFVSGVIVTDLDEKRDAYGKVEVNDIITEINGKNVSDIQDLAGELEGKTFGDIMTLKIRRRVNGLDTTLTIQVELT